MKIAIASGKGGTGKTSFSLNLYHHLKKQHNYNIQLIDCDVEEPNDALFLRSLKKVSTEIVNQYVPQINTSHCSYCRKCSDYCEFNAIVILPQAEYAQINPSLCHSCGACTYICPVEGAISEHPHAIGLIQEYGNSKEVELIEGRLKIGSPMQTMLINKLLEGSQLTADILLLDAPPGTSCPVVATVSKADYTILVTEPSPLGLHDLKLMVDLLNQLHNPFGVVINKADDKFPDLENYLSEKRIDILGKIPFSLSYANMYSQGNLFEHIPDTISQAYRHITKKLEAKIFQNA